MPPIWKRTIRTDWPKSESRAPASTMVSPVTVTALAEVKNASIQPSEGTPSAEALGSIRRALPARITAT